MPTARIGSSSKSLQNIGTQKVVGGKYTVGKSGMLDYSFTEPIFAPQTTTKAKAGGKGISPSIPFNPTFYIFGDQGPTPYPANPAGFTGSDMGATNPATIAATSASTQAKQTPKLWLLVGALALVAIIFLWRRK
jgi:hypothetical protein